MKEQRDIHNIMEILGAAEFGLVTGQKVLANGKLDIFDAPVLMGAIGEGNKKINAAIEGAEDVLLEAKDLSPEEAQQIVNKVVSMYAVLKTFKKKAA